MTTSKHLADLRALESENARLREDVLNVGAHRAAELIAERDRARALAVALEGQVAAVAALADRQEIAAQLIEDRDLLDNHFRATLHREVAADIRAALGADQ